MKFIIASDIHGSSYYCKQLVEVIRQEAPDKVILLGDLLYHGPRNDLPKGYNPKEVIEMLNGLSESIFCVRGNCEAEVDQMVLHFPVLSESMLMYWKNRLIFITHGHIHNTENAPHLHKGDILLHGHTHVQALDLTEKGFYYFNPGSVSIPKNGNQHSFMVLEDSTWSIRDLFTGDLIRSITL